MARHDHDHDDVKAAAPTAASEAGKTRKAVADDCPYPAMPEDTPEIRDALKAERDALTKEIEANEQKHKDLVAQRREIDQRIRADIADGAMDALLGPVPDLPPVTDIQTPEDESPKIEFYGYNLPRKTVTYGLLSLVAGIVMFIVFFLVIFRSILGVVEGSFSGDQIVATVVFFIAYVALMFFTGIGFVYQAIRMLRDEPDGRVRLCNVLILTMTLIFLCHLTVYGVSNALIIYGIMLALLILIHGYFQPQIALERYNEISDKKTLKEMLKRTDVERTYIPGRRSGKGYITLDFFNLFWIFTICSFLGLIIETIFHMVFVDPGVYQDRAGMLWGPLSPIYGFGGGLMTIFLNRLHDKPIWVTFIVSAIVGGAFEYFTSWYLQYAFGVTAWDYSGTFLNIDGRTNFMFMCFWGILGCVWVRLLLPIMLYFMKKIPWRWKYTLTAIFAFLVIFDGVMTTVTLDCWYLREDGVKPTGVVETFCAEHFDNEFMQNRFQSMTMNVDSSARTDQKVSTGKPSKA